MQTHPLHQHDPLASPLWTEVARRAISLRFSFPKPTEVILEGAENLPAAPVIFAPNHSHKYDFLPLRHGLLKRDRALVTWIKARAFKDPLMAGVFGRLGNLALYSRGYLIAADFENLLGRRPSEEEYRRLRDHVDHGASLPAGEVFEKLCTLPREMLGLCFAPQCMTYREAIRSLFFETMQGTLRQARRCLNAGQDMHIYPQGAVTTRLSPGKVGVIEAAIALNLPIVPVGLSGCREVFKEESLKSSGGEVRIRFGEPLHIEHERYGVGFRPFHPDDEDHHRRQLQADTNRLMDRINDLIDPSYQRAPDGVDDGKVGIARFF